MFADEFLDLMSDFVSVEPWDTTFTAEGQPNHGPAVLEVPCRIQERVRNVKDAHGVDRISTTTLYIAGGPYSSYDRFTLSASSGDNPRMALAVANHRDESAGHAYSEVYL